LLLRDLERHAQNGRTGRMKPDCRVSILRPGKRTRRACSQEKNKNCCKSSQKNFRTRLASGKRRRYQKTAWLSQDGRR
jgi:hypothetical protein